VFFACLRLFVCVMFDFVSKKLCLRGIVYIESKLFAFYRTNTFTKSNIPRRREWLSVESYFESLTIDTHEGASPKLRH
jgi:hypothetical protein